MKPAKPFFHLRMENLSAIIKDIFYASILLDFTSELNFVIGEIKLNPRSEIPIENFLKSTK